MKKKNICVVLIIAIIIIAIVVVNIFNKENGEDKNNSSETITSNKSQVDFSMKFKGVEIIPGTEFNEDDIDEMAAVSEIPSCAFDGTDKVYTYDDVEITVAEMNGKNIIYSVYFISDDIETSEGLKIADSKDKMIKLYGDDYKNDISNKYSYINGNVEISFIVENDIVIEIEYILI